jgi:hypothetical protein
MAKTVTVDEAYRRRYDNPPLRLFFGNRQVVQIFSNNEGDYSVWQLGSFRPVCLLGTVNLVSEDAAPPDGAPATSEEE